MATKDITDKEVCEAYAQAIANRKENIHIFPYEILEQRTGQPFKVCYAAMQRAAERDLVNYGVSLRTGWLTEKGKDLIKTKEL